MFRYFYERIYIFMSFSQRKISNIDFFHYSYLIAEKQCQSDHYSQNDLSGNFESSCKTFFIFFEYFYIIIKKPDKSEPNGCYQHQDNIYVTNFCEKKSRNYY